ncbi:MAG: tetratricopeptide repeat protein [Cyanobacteria bacterium J06626_6]
MVEASGNGSVAIGRDANNASITTNINQILPEPKAALTGEKNNVPDGGSENFVGREDTLEALHDQLSSADAVVITAINGMGGIGKTELAKQYAGAYAADYLDGVCWLQVRNAEVASQIVSFAGAYLDLKIPEGLELAAQVAYCWSHWPGNGRVLVVYDDVPEYEKVKGWLPPESGRFQVLMTTRQQQLARKVKPFQIEVLSEGDALELLRQIVGGERTDAEVETAKAICEWVGYLPLGLELLGCYLEENPECSYGRLYQRLEEKRVTTRALRDIYDGMTAERGVIDAFELSWESLSEKAQATACWLSLFALAQIPWTVAESTTAESEREALEYARGELVARSLLQRAAPGIFQLHQLVREYFLVKLAQREDTDELKQTYCKLMVSLARQIPGIPTQVLLLRMTPLLPHISEAATHWQDWLSNENNELAWPSVAMGRFYDGQGAYAQAEPWYERCVAAARSRFGEDHLYVADSLGNLASLYRKQGRYTEAEPLYKDALSLRQKLQGENDPAMADSLSGLAILYDRQGRYAEAEPLYKDALSLSRQLQGEDHPDVAISLDNLAGFYVRQRRYAEAESLCRDALSLRQKRLGEDHPTMADTLNNLALLHEKQGRYTEAEPLYKDALSIKQKLLGKDHPDVAVSLNNLALLYDRQGRYAEAESLYQDALSIDKKSLGMAHPEVANSLNNLASLYQKQGRYAEAEPLCRDALSLRQKLLGKDHPAVASSLNNLAGLYEKQGRYAEAESLYRDALSLRQKRLGKDHPDVAVSLNNLASLYQSQGRYAEAEPLYRDALSLKQKRLGKDHPDVAISFNNLASLYESQQLYAKAELLYLEAIQIAVPRLGQKHPNTQAFGHNYIGCITAALKAGLQDQLSDNPATQQFLASLKSQKSP